MSYVYPTIAVEAQFGGSYAAAVLADSPIGYWRLGERRGAVAYDASRPTGTNFLGDLTVVADGAYTGGYTLGQSAALLDNNSAVLFDGSSGYMSVTNAKLDSINFQTAVSVECWIKPTSVSVTGTNRYFVNGDHWSIYRLDGTLTGFVHYQDGTNSGTNLTYALSAATWYHVVLTHDGATSRLYVNGSQVASYVKASALFSALGSGALYVGAATPGIVHVDATIDEVAVYDTLLSPTRVSAHYATVTAGWTSLTADVLNERGMTISYGLGDGQPTTVIAQTGQARWSLNNSVKNSASTQGYYSPQHASHRTGFMVGIPVRVSLTYSGTTYYKFVGRLTDCVPTPGINNDQSTLCVAEDYIGDLARASLVGAALTPLTNTSLDAVIAALLTAMPAWPSAISMDTGVALWPYALVNGGAGGAINPLQECQRAALSEARGYVYIKGDTSTGGVLRVENRHARPAQVTALATLADSSLWDGLEQISALDAIVNRVDVTVHRRRADSSPVVLWEADTVVGLNVPQTIHVTYRDPTQTAARVSGINMIQPVANTDYSVNTISIGGGGDYTSQVSVTADFSGTGAELRLVNNSDRGVYFCDASGTPALQVRGTGLYDYDSPTLTAADEESQSTYGISTLAIDLPYEADADIGQGFADVILDEWATPLGYVTRVRFLATASSTLMTAALAREPGDLISVTETVTGISGTFYINGVQLDFDADRLLWCTWTLAPGQPETYWLLGTSGYSELGTTTVLYGI